MYNATAPNTSFFNFDDVIYLLRKLSNYQDLYTQKLRDILLNYLNHRNLNLLHEDLEVIDPLSETDITNSWDMGARMGFLEVIYPV